MQKGVTNVRIRFELLIDVVSMVVGVVFDDIGLVEFSGLLNLQGKCCPNFCRLSASLELDSQALMTKCLVPNDVIVDLGS